MSQVRQSQSMNWGAGSDQPLLGHQTLHHHTNIVTNLLFSPDGRYIFSSSFDGALCRWSAQIGKRQASWPTVGSYHVLTIHPDGQRVVAGSTDKIALLIDVELHRVELPDNFNRTSCFLFSEQVTCRPYRYQKQ